MLVKKTPESLLDCKEIQPVHPKGDLSWVFIGRTDVEAETPILWPPDVKSWLIWKDPDARKDWGQEEKGRTEDEMVGWHHRLNGHGFGWTPGVGDGQGGLVATIHGVAKSQTWLSDWTELNRIYNSSKSTMNYDLFLLITVKQKWQFLMVDILVSFCLVVPLSVRASEFFFFHAEGRREKRLYVKNTSTV